MAHPIISYRDFVQANHDLFIQAGGLAAKSGQASFGLAAADEDSIPALIKPAFLPAHPVVLIIAPHPDDECLMGGYAFRMQEEWGAHVWVLPYSFGSKLERQVARNEELKKAVDHLGFRLVERGSFDKLTDAEFEGYLNSLHPDVIFSPHDQDGHATHIESNQMVARVVNALAAKSAGGFVPKKILWVQTEFWHAIEKPNRLIPLSIEHVVRMGEALSLHKGEVERNPYHLRLPAWLMDQVRRGSERVIGGGAGAQAMLSVFGQIYFESTLN